VPIVVFDLDKTLVFGDSFSEFNRYLIGRSWWRTTLALLLVPVALVLLAFPTARLAGISIFVWCGTVGTTELDLFRLMDLHLAQRFEERPDLICRKAVESLLSHQESGARIVIATGCVAALAERVCRLIGVGGLEIVGSSLRRGYGGWVAERHCFGAAKVQLLEKRGVTAPWGWTYTDSIFDLPILEAAKNRVLVNPTPADRIKVTSALNGDVEVVRWR
jgi:phosphatidylglycerophosphatase C